jgi:hypothetical protein
MQQSSRELWISFIAIVFITLIYLFMVAAGWDNGGDDLFGTASGSLIHHDDHGGNVIYTHKRSRSAMWGKMSYWLQFHIFTGLVTLHGATRIHHGINGWREW